MARQGLRVVAFGGGTGLPVLLRGLREAGERVTAIVTVADDGGSSGRLRQELGVAPPGDVRSCLVALASRRRLAEVFDYRFEGGVDLRDHSVGNIIIAALSDISGGFAEGVEQAGRFLRIRGRVLPAATGSVTLVVRYTDGTVSHGESTVGQVGRAVSAVAVEPPDKPAPAAAIEAIEAADVLVLAAGSLFTSTIAALLGRGVREALASFPGPIAYIANLMTQPGETEGFTVADHLRALAEHVGPVVTDVLVNSTPLREPLLGRYRAEGAEPVRVDRAAIERLGVRVGETPLLADAGGRELRHDPERLARAVRTLIRPG
ncbi:MAG: gluconeogenesis factor YvcK family protein [Nocardioidaceae bacterium]